MHFPYIFYFNMLHVLRFTLLPAAESISVCAMHVIYYVLHQPHEIQMLERVSKKERGQNRQNCRNGGSEGAKRTSTKFCVWFEIRSKFLRDREVCANQFIFFFLTVELLISLARGRYREKQKSNFIALEIP